MKDKENLIEKIAQKQGEIAKTIDEIIQSGGGNIPDWEMIQTMNSELGQEIEELSIRQMEYSAEIEQIAESEAKNNE